MGGEDDGGTLLLKVEDFVLEEVGVDWVETAEGFVEDEEAGVVEHGDHELDFLLHAFGKFLHAAVPPGVYLETVEPLVQPMFGGGFV